ncbi:hypothetical protein KC950_02615 [Candidatus Saccharibacteria bacterium]|nr:hypothetical protein [Candidatus Saccharibacteria bacterium]
MKIKNNQKVLMQRGLLFLGAFVIGLNLIVPGFEWTVLLGLLPFLFYIDNLKSVTNRRAYLDFYISGVIIYGFAYLFLLQADSANWQFVFSGWFAIFAGVCAWLFASFASALSFLLIPLIIYKIQRETLRIMVFPLVWVCVEIVSAFAFSVISYGPGGSIGVDVNFGSIATIASSLPIVFTSRIVGFYGLSLVVCYLALAVYIAARYKQYIRAGAIVVLILMLILVGHNLNKAKNSARSLKVVAIHMNAFDTAANIKDLTSIPNDIDILVMPEYSEVQKQDNFKEFLAKLSNTGVLITTVQESESPTATNNLIYLNKNGNDISFQPKHRLIPAGEYMPYSLLATFKAIGKQDSVDLFNYSQKIQPSENSISAVKYNDVKYGALPCSGVLSTTSYKKLANDGAEVLINPASLSLLRDDSRYHVLAKRMARFQAVYNQKPFVQASRSGASYVISSNGEFKAPSIGSATQIIESTINLR